MAPRRPPRLELCREIARANAPIAPTQRIRAIVHDEGRVRTATEPWPFMDELRAALADDRDLTLDTDNQLALPLSVLAAGATR